MKTVGERIKYLIDKQGVSLRQFCKNNDILYTGMSSIISNDREIGMKVLHQLKKAIPEMDTEWLLFGTERIENISKYSNIEIPLLEVDKSNKIHPTWEQVEQMVLQYLEEDRVQDKIRKIARTSDK